MNPRFLPGFEIPPRIRISAQLGKLLPASDLLVSAVPTKFLRSVWARHAPLLPADLPILSLSKGLEEGTDLRPTQVLAEITGRRPLAVLSGPNIAREVARGLPAASVVASEDKALAHAVQTALSTDRFRVYRNPDVVGVELGGALKNVIAIAAGICDGLAWARTRRRPSSTGGSSRWPARRAARRTRRTFFGLSGLGDLLTTCYSPVSRNRTFGERLGGANGPRTSREHEPGRGRGEDLGPGPRPPERLGLPLPIAEQVYLVSTGKSPRETVRSLMTRGHKDEAEDLT